MSQVQFPRILTLLDKCSGPACWRTFQPTAELQRYGVQVDWEFVGEHVAEERAHLRLPAIPEQTVEEMLARICSGNVDAVVLARLGWPEGQDKAMRHFLGALKKAGNTLIYEADDDVFSSHIVIQQKTGLLRDQDQSKLEGERLTRIECLRLCDGATVSTPRLRTVVSRFVPDDFPIEVVPNMIDWRWWQQIKQVAQRWVPPLTIGWAGGGRPDDDLAEMAWAWGEVAKLDQDVKFVVAGCRVDEHGQPSIAATPWTKQILDYVPAERLVALPFLGLQEYPLNYLNIDIGCCPLAPRSFNYAKTPIKAWEHAAAGAAVVCSPTVYGARESYLNEPAYAFIAHDRGQWRDFLMQLVRDPVFRRMQAESLAQRVESEHSLQRHVLEWPMAWASIIEQAHERRSRKLVLAGVN